MVDVAGELHRQGGADGGREAAHRQGQEGRAHRALFGLGPEALPLHDQQGEHAGADQQGDDVGGVDDVEDQRGHQQPHGHQPRAALTLEHAARQHDHADARDRHQRPGGLGHLNGHVLGDEVDVVVHRRRHGGEEIDQPGDEQGGGGDPADAPHPDPVGGHLRRRRPGGATGPAGHQFGMKVGGVGSPLDHGVMGQQPFAHGGQRQVDLGVHQADVQIRPGLHLDHRLLAVVQEGRGQAEPPPVLVHHL